MKINDVTEQSKQNPIGVGTWVVIGGDLHVVAQTTSGRVKLIAFAEGGDVNRSYVNNKGEGVLWKREDSSYNDFSQEVIDELFDYVVKSGYEKIQIVDVEINYKVKEDKTIIFKN